MVVIYIALSCRMMTVLLLAFQSLHRSRVSFSGFALPSAALTTVFDEMTAMGSLVFLTAERNLQCFSFLCEVSCRCS